MAKKELTLPKDFNELLTDGNIDQLKSIYDKCELTAHDEDLCTPLHMGGVHELSYLACRTGLDINILIIMEQLLCIKSATMGRETVKLCSDCRC